VAPDDTADEIKTFLIADVRGYTVFTQERGDEASAALIARFADVVREQVEARDGSVIELRGDEALAVFRSPRQAIRAAVELQARLLQETLATPDLPLPAGIGLDAGEAVQIEGGTAVAEPAARLRSAGPGEILCSQSSVAVSMAVRPPPITIAGSCTSKDSPIRSTSWRSLQRVSTSRGG
jgi:class 3 adenylate cyclase